ncbi:hypothetical protein TNCV_3670101 [Trichonephila clavipes]|nr:hypothetical protein TNCV_3670101 [Trichonephila clavipes]
MTIGHINDGLAIKFKKKRMDGQSYDVAKGPYSKSFSEKGGTQGDSHSFYSTTSVYSLSLPQDNLLRTGIRSPLISVLLFSLISPGLRLRFLPSILRNLSQHASRLLSLAGHPKSADSHRPH